MSNFLEFIEEDIEAKKTLLSAMPTNTKPNKRKFNEKLDEIINKYDEYKKAVEKYIEMKQKKLENKTKSTKEKELEKEVEKYKHIHSLLNPLNGYYEKIGFDKLMYKITNYQFFNFNSLIEIIDAFIDKFEAAGIKLNKNDFTYTCFVNQYMEEFLKVKESGTNDYDTVSHIFEKIYWVNPEIIEHIELNLKYLIKKYSNNFESYINTEKKKILSESGIKDFNECNSKLNQAIRDLKLSKSENISDIIKMSKDGVIDISHYFEDSKVLISTFDSLMIKPSLKDDKEKMEDFYDSLEKTKTKRL